MEINTLALIGCGVGILALFVMAYILILSETNPHISKSPKHWEGNKDGNNIK